MRSMIITGSPYWSKYLTATLNNNGLPSKHIHYGLLNIAILFRDRKSNLLAVGLGGKSHSKTIIIWLAIMLWWLLHRRKNSLYVYWIGTDVFSAKSNGVNTLVSLVWRITGATHICGAKWFVNDLSSVNIAATTVIFPYDTRPAEELADKLPTPGASVQFCAYLTANSWNNMNGSIIMKLAEELPQSHWDVIGMQENQVPSIDGAPPNVKFHGWVDDPLSVIARNHVFVRLANHDAYSGIVRDAQTMSRIVVYTKDVIGVAQVSISNYGELLKVFRILSDKILSGHPPASSAPNLPSYETQIKELIRTVSK